MVQMGSSGTSHRARNQTHALALLVLLALFACRVAAQLVQRFWPTPLVASEYSSPRVAMVESAEDWLDHDPAIAL